MYFKGGKLKTLEHKDKESLQAEWIDPVHIQNKSLPIRYIIARHLQSSMLFSALKIGNEHKFHPCITQWLQLCLVGFIFHNYRLNKA